MKRIVYLPWWRGCEDNWKGRLTALAWTDGTFLRAFAIAASSKEWSWARNTHIILGIFSLLICKFHLTNCCTNYHKMTRHKKETHCRKAVLTLQNCAHEEDIAWSQQSGIQPVQPWPQQQLWTLKQRSAGAHAISTPALCPIPPSWSLPFTTQILHLRWRHPALIKDCIMISIQFSTGHCVPWAVRAGDQQKEVIPIVTWRKTSGER